MPFWQVDIILWSHLYRRKTLIDFRIRAQNRKRETYPLDADNDKNGYSDSQSDTLLEPIRGQDWDSNRSICQPPHYEKDELIT
jgi:hypothetical protein